MKYHLKLLLLGCLISVQEGSSQTIQQVQALLQFADQKELEYIMKKTFADSFAVANGYTIFSEDSNGIAIELQSIEDGSPEYYVTLNYGAAQTISTEKVWPGRPYEFSLDGSNETLGLWDVGKVYLEHQEFPNNCITQVDHSIQDAKHATPVAGTMIARGIKPLARGMANAASLVAYDWSNDFSEMARAAASGLKVSNHSYGGRVGWFYEEGKIIPYWMGFMSVSRTEDCTFGGYGGYAQDYDSIAVLAPNYLIVQAAGNNRGEGPPINNQPILHLIFSESLKDFILDSTSIHDEDGGNDGYDCLEPRAVAKNIITVGAVWKDTNGYSDPSSVDLISTSSIGPTDDGRIKPDVVAPGHYLHTTCKTNDACYYNVTGTSVAAPCVTGSIGLLLQLQRQLKGDQKLLSSTLKSIVIHTADEAGDYIGPDYRFGWGLMNTLKTAQLMKNNHERGDINIFERTLSQSDELEFSILSSGTEPIRTTICWTDPPGQVVTKRLNDRTPKLRNDIDLRIIGPGGTIYFPYLLDPDNPSLAASRGDNIRDNVEQVFIQSPTPGLYTVRINHKGILQGGSQNVSIIITGHSIVNMTLDQKLNDQMTSIDSISRWEGGSAFKQYSVPKQLSLLEETQEILRASRKIISNQKYNKWNLDNNIVNYRQFTIQSGITEIRSNFNQTKDSIVIKNEIIGSVITMGGIIELKDPWLVDTTDGRFYQSPYGYRNLGMDASFKPESSPFNPYHNSKYKGVFLDQLVSGGVYYSVRVPRTQTIGNFSCVFDHWEATGADVTSPTDTVTPVIFRANGAVVKAMYRATSASITCAMDSAWNLVSVPDTTLNMYKLNVYPDFSDSWVYTSNGGPYISVDTLKVGRGYWVKYKPNKSVTYYGKPAFNVSVALNTGWNMIGSLSLPITKDKIKTEPADIIESGYYEYTGSGYRYCDTIKPGNGYWVKLLSPGGIILNLTNAEPIPDIIIAQPPSPPGAPLAPALLSPVNGATGVSNPPNLCWNESETSTSYNIQVGTSSAFTTVVFQDNGTTFTCSFAGGLAYNTTYYWKVKAVNQFGESNWSSIRWFTTQSAPPPDPDPDPDPCLTSSSITALDEFTVINGEGKKQTLYAKNGKHKLDVGFTNFDMPPEPIGGLFHAKFKTDKFIENIPPGKGFLKIPIKLKNAQYPITINWKIKDGNGVKYWITKSGDDKDKQPLSGNGSMGLGSTKDGDIIIIAQAIDPCDIVYKSGIQEGIEEQLLQLPTDYKLEQNTPNPFNPTTIVNYQLPIDNWVTIKVYNILGEEVATLVDGMQDAGYKSVIFDGSNFSSGIYFIRMNSGSYSDVKKIVLAK